MAIHLKQKITSFESFLLRANEEMQKLLPIYEFLSSQEKIPAKNRKLIECVCGENISCNTQQFKREHLLNDYHFDEFYNAKQ